jgi:prepilin-type N-terminal cleavage/methylation domain-containing protein
MVAMRLTRTVNRTDHNDNHFDQLKVTRNRAEQLEHQRCERFSASAQATIRREIRPMRIEVNKLQSGRRAGFTLVELMMVIAIIAILVGLTVAGLTQGARAIKRRAIALEVASLAQAVEAYKLKYGEYPPDGSNKAAFVAHFRSAFPNILSAEFDALEAAPSGQQTRVANSNYPFGIMDPAEALVFCLGGFSNDPTRPFTGPGGPLISLPPPPNGPGGFQYNMDRNSGFFDFAEERLSLVVAGGITVSNDEDPDVLGTLSVPGSPPVGQRDLMPVYTPRGLKAPYVYFAASTYSFPIAGQTPPRNYYNHYKASTVEGVARPYKSEQVNTNVLPNSMTNRERHYRYMNEKSFQIVSAGLDDDYGGVWELVHTDQTPVFFTFPSGAVLDIVAGTSGGTGYVNPTGGPSGQLDNVTNFSEGTLESSLP